MSGPRIPTDSDIRAMVGPTRAGTYDAYTRERVGGSTLSATRSDILTRSGRIDCALCTRPMLNTCRDDRAELGHLVPSAWTRTGDGGWVVRSAVVAMVGHAAMSLMCGRCNNRAADRMILPSDLLHGEHYVMGAAPKPSPKGNDPYDDIRHDRLGW